MRLFRLGIFSLLLSTLLLSPSWGQGINVAPGGVATQSTNHPAGPAGNGIDGNLGNFTHTLPDDLEPTWEVDLGQLYNIERIVLHNRDSCCAERLRDIVVTILDDTLTEVYVSAILNEADELFSPEFIDLDIIFEEGDPIEGQIVRVSRIRDEADPNGGVLSLGEVEVYAELDSILITSQPQAATIETGSTHTFSVEASGPGNLSYQWFKDGAEIAGAVESTLDLADVTSEDEGLYKVVITSDDAGTDPLESDEVELRVPGRNIARWGFAIQSTEGFGGAPGRAIDGNTTGVYNQGSTTHTNTGDPTPWWEVQLFGPSSIGSINIWNRTDCCSARLTNFRVLIFEVNDAGERVELFNEIFFEEGGFPDTALDGPLEIPVDIADPIASVVRIERLGAPEDFPGQFFLSLSEVQIFGDGEEPPPNPDLTKRDGVTATQSSTLGGFTAGIGIDGNLANFTHTLAGAETPDPSWWEVDLGSSNRIAKINLHNRSNCCGSRLRDITVFILDEDRNEVYVSELLNEENELGFEINGNLFPLGPPLLTIDIIADEGAAIEGRYVRVERTPDDDLSGSDLQGNEDEATVLSLGEVEVFEEQDCPADGDTHCEGLTITAPEGGGPGIYEVTANATDDSEDRITYTFRAENADDGQVITVGPQDVLNTATFNLGLGTWDITVSVDDGTLCDDVADDAECSDVIEVELGANVAPGGIATQSSVGFGFPADLAIDGNTGNFTHTAANDLFPDNSWWMLELDDVYPLERIVIHNRDNCCGSRLRDITVFLLDENQEIIYESELLNEENDLGFEVNGNKFPLGPELLEVNLVDDTGDLVDAKFVRIERTPDDDFSGSDGQGNADEATVISLGEVEVYRGTDIIDPTGPEFFRGDTDGNGLIEITDPINNLAFQFLGTFTPPCMDAADFDDNGKVEITDPIANLSHQFLGTAPPAPPGKETCGEDPSDDDPETGDLGCLVEPNCG